MGGIGSTIGEAENGDPILDGGGGFFADFAQAFLEGAGTARDGEENGKSARAEMRFFAFENVRKFCRSQNRRGELKEANVIGAIGKPVGAGAEIDGGGHD
jgi:hypothetical protein